MGGHGALALALRNPDRYRSVSALRADRRAAPGALGPEGVRRLPGRRSRGLVRLRRHRAGPGAAAAGASCSSTQGTADKFLETQLRPELFEAACAEAGQPLTLRRQTGYDHSYYFIATFVDDHLAHHARALSP